MARIRSVSLVAVGALLAVSLAPLAVAAPANAATLAPSGLSTGFQLDGNKSAGVPPDTFDWDDFLTPPQPNGAYTFTPTGPYTTADGNASTGILDATFDWDNGSLAASCSDTTTDATGAPGSQTPNTIPWAPGPANVNDKGNLCSTASAYEVVSTDDGVRHLVLYNYWTRLVGNGSVSVLQLLEGPALGRCDDILVVFDYNSNTSTVTVHFRRWAPALGDACANPNAPGAWLPTGDPIDFAWAVGVRTEGPLPVGNQPQATFGEFGVDLTEAGLFSPGECTTFQVSTMLTRTGTDFGAQTQDYYVPDADALTIANCGTLSVTKETLPAGIDSDDRFDTVIDRTGGGIVLPATDATEIVDDIGIGETNTYEGVLAATDYQLVETISGPWAMQSMLCSTLVPGTRLPVEFVLDDASDVFTVYPSTITQCRIVNATSTVTVTKQTLPDGAEQLFDFDIGGQQASLGDGQSATFAFAPGSQVDISETVPAGWLDSATITCTDGSAVIDEDAPSATVTTVAGQDVACTFTNTQLGNIRIAKELFGPPGGTFDFTGDWTTGDPLLPPGGEFSIEALTGDGIDYFATFTGVEPGDYSVTELADTVNGTLLVTLLCTIDGQDVFFEGTATADFTLAPGETVTCYFTNASPGQIFVLKETVPFEYDQDFGFEFESQADPTPVPFTLNAGVQDEATWASPQLEGGTYTVTELGGVPDWALTDITCDVPGGSFTADLDAGTAEIQLPDSGIAGCRFTNTATPGQATVAKTATGIADGFDWSFDFDLVNDDSGEVQTLAVDTANPTATFTDLAPGVNYTLNEVSAEGWTSTLSCTGLDDLDPATAGWQFVGPPAFDLQCTAENTAAPADVTITKTVTAVADTLDWSFDFTLDPADGVTPGAEQAVTGTGPSTGSATWQGLLPGETYTLTEADAAGWIEGTIQCQAGALVDLDPEVPGFQFEAQPGLSLACTVSNTPEPIDLTVTKTALGGDGTFQFVLTPIDPVGEAMVGSVATSAGTGVAVFTGLVAGTEYRLEELEFANWISGELTCQVSRSGTVDDLVLTRFTVMAGDNVTCAITNRAVGTIVVAKQVEGDDGTFSFVGDWAEPAEFTIETTDGSGSAVFPGIAPGTYTVEELALEGYENTDLVCVDGDADGEVSSVQGALGTIELDPGETVVCTYTNVQRGPVEVEKVVIGDPEFGDGGAVTVRYGITVTNTSTLEQPYDLHDRIRFGQGIAIESATVVSDDGVVVNAGWDGIDDTLVAAGAVLGSNAVHTYSVTVSARIPVGITADQADCSVGSPTEGSGLLNTATVAFWNGDGSDEADACAPVPVPVTAPAGGLSPTGVSLTALWYALLLIVGGAAVLVVRRARPARS
ncbi:MSCRAMM family protein [Agromyces cerinus]|uniref:Uncharacterized protein n=1 Tax=Agromyces cerinus subsp. cerinus TaxID=232089 RepID=A0A1N6F920_9MICO|nr:prealbumin-like fold domain-containing protein [Agromyces cerinus]SIN91694.1 hypothetical protein SAMN05443544_1849 [Agromyces cerinus subsp. cerinus]